MDTLQLWLLIAICVGFVLAAFLLVFLIVRFCRGYSDTHSHTSVNLVEEGGCALHFVDMLGNPRTIDVHSMAITDAVSLQSALARVCGLHDAASLSLVQLNEMGGRVEVDLDRLVRADGGLESRMCHTAHRPLLLSRRRSEPQPTARTWQQTNTAHQGGDSVMDVNTGRGASRASLWREQDAGDAPSERCGNSDVPPPVILPLSSRICSTTPVTIMAMRYIRQSDGARLDEESAILIEEAMRSGARRTVTLPNSSHVTVEPSKAAALLFDGGDDRNGVPLLRQEAEVLHYTFDDAGSVQWRSYKHPIYLPPGRWCICAKSSTTDHRFVETRSRVFTVDIVP